MPYTDAALDTQINAQATAATRISFHTADPGSTGTSEISGTGRPATTWAAADAHPVSGRRRVGSQVSAPIPAGTTVTHWGLFTAATGGTFHYGGALATAETFGSAGTIQHTPTLRQTGA